MVETLEQVRADIDQRLITAARGRHSPMHTPVVATSDADMRVMVLREYDLQKCTLRFHTDSRAPKAAIIAALPQVGVLFYDREAKVQIRCRGTGEVLTGGVQVDAAWHASTPFARRCYLGDAPSSGSDCPTSGLPLHIEGIEPEEAELIAARANFAILLITVTAFDWFALAQTGHRRAVFDCAGPRWLTP